MAGPEQITRTAPKIKSLLQSADSCIWIIPPKNNQLIVMNAITIAAIPVSKIPVRVKLAIVFLLILITFF